MWAFLLGEISMITLAQLTEMLDMQEKLEVRIDGPDWRNKEHDYRLCIHMECAEIIDHMGWKHWKHVNAEPNWDAISMELVDVWHFAMAYALTFEDFEPVFLYEDIIWANAKYDPENQASMIQLCIGMGYSMFKHNRFTVGNFIEMMILANMTWNDLYKLYIGKNVLNWFRQDHGYKEGLYMKSWAGKEDNEHLFEITKMLEDNFNSVELIKCLTARYALAGH